MTSRYKGGRGKKAPYSTSVVRVPSKLVPHIEEMIEEYVDLLEATGEDPVDHYNAESPYRCDIRYGDAVVAAKKILAQKKSAKQSVIKLLQVLYPQIISIEEALTK